MSNFSLVKVAISYESAIATVRPDELRKKIKGQIGRDPGDMSEPDGLIRYFLSVLDNNLPPDVPEKMKGTAVIFLKREMFKDMQATIDARGTVDINFPSFNIAQAHGPIEDFGRLYRYLPRYNAEYGQTLQDLLSFQGIRELQDVVFYLEQYENADLMKRHGPAWAASLRPKAIETTQLIKGDMEQSLVPPKDLNQYDETQDLVKGRFNKDEWTILVPNSIEAARYWGHQTDWCTAHPRDSHNYYDHYSKQGKLFIFINKRTGHRYQFHFASKQYKNQYDVDVENARLLAGLATLLRENAGEELVSQEGIPGPLKLHDMISESRYGELTDDSRMLSQPDEDGLVTSEVTKNGAMPAFIHRVNGQVVLIWTKDSQYHRTDGPAVISIGSNPEMRYFLNGNPVEGPEGWRIWENNENVFTKDFHYSKAGHVEHLFGESWGSYRRDQHGQVMSTSSKDRSVPSFVAGTMDSFSKGLKDGQALFESELIRWAPLMNKPTKQAAPKFTLIKSPDAPVAEDKVTVNGVHLLHEQTVKEHSLAQNAAQEISSLFAPAVIKHFMGEYDPEVICDNGQLTAAGLHMSEQVLDFITDAFVPMEVPTGAEIAQTERYDPSLMTRIKSLLAKGYWTEATMLQAGSEIYVRDTETFYKELFLDLDQAIQREIIRECSGTAPAFSGLRLVKND